MGTWVKLDSGIWVALDERGYYRTKEKKLLHREIYEQAYGPIPTGWVVHHIDFDKLNNEPLNLIALPEEFHTQIHGTMRSERRRFDRVEIIQRVKDIFQVYADGYCDMLQEKVELERLFGDKIRRFLFLEKHLKSLLKSRAVLVEGIDHLPLLSQLPKDVTKPKVILRKK